MKTEDFDLIILGGGNAITVGIRAAQKGWKVAVVERDRLGGTCPNRGCIPSKLLLGYAEVATTIREASRFFMDAGLDGVDRARILKETKAATLAATDGKIAANLPEKVTLIRGEGRFLANDLIEVNGRRLRAAKIVVGTGTRPRVLDIPGLEGTPYWDSDAVFSLEEAPRSVAILGGGFIACELAFFFRAIGVETTLIHRGATLLKEEDRDIQTIFLKGFGEQVPLRLETTVEEVRHEGGRFHLSLAGPKGQTAALEAEALLVAIGRIPNTDALGLDQTDIGLDERGYIEVDERMQTTVPGVFALGDVVGRYFFTHSAAWEATHVADCLLEGKEEVIDYGPMPHAVFSHPEIAGVGATEDELEANSVDYSATSLPYSSAAKGRAIKEEHGLCKILLAPDGEILGCHIVGSQASVLIHQVMTAMRWRNHISSLTDMIYIHPALSEVVRNTARKARAALAES